MDGGAGSRDAVSVKLRRQFQLSGKKSAQFIVLVNAGRNLDLPRIFWRR
jgi:hypothetical protein